MFKKHKGLIIAGVVILVVIVIGGFLWVSNNANSQSQQAQQVSDNSVQTLSPNAIGLKLEASPDKKKVRYTITSASDIKSIEYELTYNANATAQEQSEGADAQVQRGITGTANITSGSGNYQSSWLILGSQSANVVRYDTGVNGVAITLKITKNDGKVYQVQDKLNF
jgi:FtsZ-interacting cell division protein ZipA